MTKAELVNEISTTTGIEKVAVQQTIESMMKVVRNSLINDENGSNQTGQFQIKNYT